MEEVGIQRKLTAILSADVAGYSRLMQDDELATLNTLSRCREVMSDLILQHKGRVIDSVGDNLLAEFSSVVDGVQSAVAIQKELAIVNADLASGRRMDFRIGINVGDVIQEGERIYGDGVNIAARLEKLADPGGICISRTAYDQIESKLPFGYEYLGQKAVKNISKPIHAYRVLIHPENQALSGPGVRSDRLEEAAEGGRTDSFQRIKDRVQDFARDISKDEHLRGAIKETRDRARGFAEEISSDPAGRWRALRRLIRHKHVQVFLGLAVFLPAINAATSYGRWWFQYPLVSVGLAIYIHWLMRTFFSAQRLKELKDRLYRAELAGLSGRPGEDGQARLEDRVSALIAYYRHLYLYLGVTPFLVLLNLLTNPFNWWFLYPGLGWGILLFFHWVKVRQR